jgi:hypothetical protein
VTLMLSLFPHCAHSFIEPDCASIRRRHKPSVLLSETTSFRYQRPLRAPTGTSSIPCPFPQARCVCASDAPPLASYPPLLTLPLFLHFRMFEIRSFSSRSQCCTRTRPCGALTHTSSALIAGLSLVVCLLPRSCPLAGAVSSRSATALGTVLGGAWVRYPFNFAHPPSSLLPTAVR